MSYGPSTVQHARVHENIGAHCFHVGLDSPQMSLNWIDFYSQSEKALYWSDLRALCLFHGLRMFPNFAILM